MRLNLPPSALTSTRSASERPAGARRARSTSRGMAAAAAAARGGTVVSDMDAQVDAQQATGVRGIDEGEG